MTVVLAQYPTPFHRALLKGVGMHSEMDGGTLRPAAAD
jgi:hypothetical protein